MAANGTSKSHSRRAAVLDAVLQAFYSRQARRKCGQRLRTLGTGQIRLKNTVKGEGLPVLGHGELYEDMASTESTA